ncbi:MAG: hypothetical protein WAK19_05120 [Candidatus Cybelea sp.]
MRPVGERDPAVDTEELGIGLGVAFGVLQVLGARFILDRDGDVLNEIGEPFGQRLERLFDHALEFGTRQALTGHYEIEESGNERSICPR